MVMIIVTHEMKFAADVADWVILMDGGLIIEEGPPEKVLDNPQSARAIQFLNRLANYELE
jgi:cystine transport system ATP-binding protein